MEAETKETLKAIDQKLDVLAVAVDQRFDKIKNIILAYLEAGSSISLATVKANLKSV